MRIVIAGWESLTSERDAVRRVLVTADAKSAYRSRVWNKAVIEAGSRVSYRKP